jgi:hypothetical protein
VLAIGLPAPSACASAASSSGDAVAWKAHGDKHRTLGGNIQIIGKPEHDVDKLVGLKQAGCDGIQVAFFDFTPGRAAGMTATRRLASDVQGSAFKARVSPVGVSGMTHLHFSSQSDRGQRRTAFGQGRLSSSG